MVRAERYSYTNLLRSLLDGVSHKPVNANRCETNANTLKMESNSISKFCRASSGIRCPAWCEFPTLESLR